MLATTVVLCASGSFQIPALENQNRAADRHRRIEQRIERVVHDQLAGHRLAVRNRLITFNAEKFGTR